MEPETQNITFHHTIDIQIRFNDVDCFGHVNNNAYFAYYDLGKEAYLTDVLKEDFRTSKVVPVVANINADFFQPILFGDKIQVQTAITHIGNKSFTLLQEAVNKDTEAVVCRCTSVMVCFNTKTGLPQELPDEYRMSITSYEKGNV